MRLKPLIYLLLLLMAVNYVSAQDVFIEECIISLNPVIGLGRKIPLICNLTFQVPLDCVIFVVANGTVLSTSPEVNSIQGIGLINSFTTVNGLLHGYYNQFLMQTNTSYEIMIDCDGHLENFTVVPQHKGLTEVTGGLIWAKDNGSIIILVGLILSLGIGIILGLAKYFRII